LLPKERVLTALSNREPDRVPIDLGGTIVTGLRKGFYSKLLKSWNKERKIQILDHVQQLARVEEDIMEKLLIDVRGFLPGVSRKRPVINKNMEYYFFTDEWGILWGMPEKEGLYFSILCNPLKDASNISDIENYPWPEPKMEIIEDWSREINHLGENYVVVVESYGSGIFEMALRLRGYEKFLMDLALSPKIAETILEKILEVKMKYIDILSTKLNGYFQILREGDDLSTQQSLIISREMYRKFIMPRHKRLFDYAKRKILSPFFIFFHSCGAVSEIIPDFIETGIDILNPIQFNAVGMNSEMLKRDFGSFITFWGGGVDSQNTLPYADPEKVREEVKRQIEIFASGGGFVFASVHNIQDDVPMENFTTMWNVWDECSKY